MLPAPIPSNESERIASLRKMLLLSTPDEEAFDRVTRMAQRLFGVPIALLSLIDDHRQWFKSCIGLPVRETGRDISFCGHAIMSDDLFVIENAREDGRFADNPLVTNPPHVIFYAGRPLRNAEGFRIGTLCVIDHEPRSFSTEDRRSLSDLGCWMENLFLTRDLGEAEKAILEELDEVRRTSLLDPMLNIWNRRAIADMHEKETQRAFRSKSSLSLMLIEIDDLNQIIDAHRQAAGDAVLIEFSKRLRAIARTYDSIGRTDSNRFMVILPETDLATTRKMAERLLSAITIAPILAGEEVLSISASIGLAGAHYGEETPDKEVLLARAETALQQAIEKGRSQIACSA